MKDDKTLMLDHLTSATTLHKICLKLFNPEYINWEPEALEIELTERFGKEIPNINFDKLHGVCTLVSTDLYYTYWESFEVISNVFNCNDPMFNTLTPMNGEQLCWSIVEARLNDLEQFTEKGMFSDEVEAYIQVTLRNNGLVRYPIIIKKYMQTEYDEFKGLNPTQQSLVVEYENEISSFIRSRLKKIKEENS